MRKPWHSIIPPEEEAIYKSVGFGTDLRFGKRPVLLVIDVQYRTIGHKPLPIKEAVKEYPTSCGEYGWRAIPYINQILSAFRNRGLPVVFPHVAVKDKVTEGRFADKMPSVLSVPKQGYELAREIAPVAGEIVLPKGFPSAFFATPLISHLVNLRVDTVVVAGCTTSGCIRSTAIDAFSYNFNVIVPYECVYDRSQVSHAVNLFDIASKYGNVVGTDEVLRAISSL